MIIGWCLPETSTQRDAGRHCHGGEWQFDVNKINVTGDDKRHASCAKPVTRLVSSIRTLRLMFGTHQLIMTTWLKQKHSFYRTQIKTYLVILYSLELWSISLSEFSINLIFKLVKLKIWISVALGDWVFQPKPLSLIHLQSLSTTFQVFVIFNRQET